MGSLVVGERGLIRRLKLDQTRRGRSHDEDVMRAGRYERLSTDYVLGMNVGIYRRQKWEPLKEAIFALERARSAMRLAVSLRKIATEAERKLRATESKQRQLDVLHERLSNLFYDSHKRLLQTQIQLQAMIHASNDAMHFVQHQLKLFADVSSSSSTNSFDPLENANDHIWIKRKYEAKKSMIHRTQEREEARTSFLRIRDRAMAHVLEVEKARKKFDEANAAAQAAEADAKVLNEQAQRVDEMKYDVLNRLLEMLTLRTLPMVFGGWHLRYRDAQYISQQAFVGQKPKRKLFIVSVLEDPLDPAMNVPPFVGCIMLSIYDPRSRRRTMINLQGNELKDALGDRFPGLFEPIEEDADTQFLCKTPGCGERVRARRRMISLGEGEPRRRGPPYEGLGIGVDGLGGPILRCPKCSTVFRTPGPDLWACKTGTWHAGYSQRRELFDRRRKSIVNELVAILRLDRFAPDTVVLDAMVYKRNRRVLEERLVRTQWMQDVLRGKSSMKGIEIFREGRKIGGRYVSISVHENCGDLLFETYHARSGFGGTLMVKYDDVSDALRETPEWADYWESSVKTCKYSEDLMRHLCNKLDFVKAGAFIPAPWEGHVKYQWDGHHPKEGQHRGQNEVAMIRKQMDLERKSKMEASSG